MYNPDDPNTWDKAQNKWAETKGTYKGLHQKDSARQDDLDSNGRNRQEVEAAGVQGRVNSWDDQAPNEQQPYAGYAYEDPYKGLSPVHQKPNWRSMVPSQVSIVHGLA